MAMTTEEATKFRGQLIAFREKVIGDVNQLLKQLEIDVNSTEKSKEEEKKEEKK